jgi:transcriptional regulator with GAF, ATPase, and Fis domain
MADLDSINTKNETPKLTHNDYKKIEYITDLAIILGQQNEFQEILRVVSSKASTIFNAQITSIMMINPGTQNTIKTIIKKVKNNRGKDYKFVQTNVIGWVAKNNQSLLVNDIRTDVRFRKNLFKDTSIRSVMCAPLKSEGISIGYLVLFDKSDNAKFELEELTLLEKFAAIAAPFLSNVQKIEQYFNTPLPQAALIAQYEQYGLIGKSNNFIELLRAVEAAVRCDVRILLEGKSGTGKELIARAIHQCSSRKQYPFVAIDCGAIPENLIESELFGHVKGAFTGANHERKGLIEEANRGTLFIDEIANLPFNMQAKLLRVIQEGEIRVVGSNKIRKVDVRFISASSSSLHDLVDKQQFREDLYYRLHVYPINVPTLNERQEDIPLLANNFLTKFAKKQQKQVSSFDRSVLDFMQKKNWSGNIRELENFVERLVTLLSPDKSVIDYDILPSEFQEEFKILPMSREDHSIGKSLQEDLAEYEKHLIRQTLMQNNWNQSKAARILKISERTMRYKMEKLGINKP